MKIIKLRAQRKERRKKHVRKSIFGTPDRLRLTVFRSLSNIYAQVINDVDGVTLVSASSIDKDIKAKITPEMTKVQLSELVGSEVAKKALASQITKVAFDRNGYIYHGRIKALADAARKAGLEF
ncbi:MAG: 50S ribosomal protein L18 [Ignavibacteriae bacterium HGW-Ignavibacteriae-1]|jgi:large subunit ribosomal protein L18|nr:MAG: 50S ribosomal protein L18 [Ignavibacteriae bacterium HGW-Ignavibacteriae-1]